MGRGRSERYGEIAAEFARLKVDVIVTSGGAVLAAKRETSVIPIVFAMAVAREIAGRSPHAIRAAKRMLNNLSVDPGPALLAESVEQQKLIGAPNQTEAERANLEKRAPRFAGRP